MVMIKVCKELVTVYQIFTRHFQVLLTLSLQMKTLEAFVDSEDQDQTAQNVQTDPWSTLSTFSC